MNFLWSILAGLVVWFIMPFIAPLQGDIRLGAAIVGVILAFVIFFAIGKLSYNRGLVAARVVAAEKVEAARKAETEERPEAGGGMQIGVGVKANKNVTVRTGAIRSSGDGSVEVGKDIEAGENASISTNDVQKKP